MERYNAGTEVDAAARLIPAADLVIRRGIRLGWHYDRRVIELEATDEGIAERSPGVTFVIPWSETPDVAGRLGSLALSRALKTSSDRLAPQVATKARFGRW